MNEHFGRGRTFLVIVICVATLVAGLVTAAPTRAIVNGEPAPLGTFDFVAEVAIGRDINGDGDADTGGSCTGTLIHPMWILTAAHCLGQDYVPNDPLTTVTMRIGNKQRGVGVERRTAAEVRIHPTFDGEGYDDVAILRLDRPSYMRPIKLASPAYRSRWTTDPASNAVYGFAFGWGMMLGGTQADIIQRAHVRLAAATLDTDYSAKIHLDTAANGGKGTCQGDSGGPLLVRADNDELREVGVLRATDCPGRDEYSEVGAGPNRDWIRAQIPDIDSPRPAADHEPWNYRGAPVAGGGCGSSGGCQTYHTFDHAPAVASYKDVQRMFVVTNGTIHTRARYGESWTGWTALDGYTNAKVAAVMSGPDTVDLFARGGDNVMYRKQMRSGVWEAWRSIGGTLKSGPAAVIERNGEIHVFARGLDDAVWEWNNTSFSWRSRGGRVTSELGAAYFGGTRVDAFARGTDNRLWQLVVDRENAWWFRHDGTLTSGPAVAARSNGLLDVYVRGTDNALWHKAWDGYRWLAWDQRGGVLTADPAAALGRDEAIDVYVRGTDAALWQKPT